MAAVGTVVAIETATTCFHHRDRETGRACTRCGRPACAECLHDAAVGSHCWECIRAARPPLRQRARMWNASVGAVVTKVLVAANVVVFLYAMTAAQSAVGGTVRRGSFERDLALSARFVEAGEWWRLFTSGFVHYGLLHLAFNMVLLYQFGSMLEPAIGRVRFVALYAAALLAGSFGALLVSPSALTAGASGAVFGLVGASAMGMRQRGISVWDSGVGGLLVINLVLTFVLPNISIGGHVGGLAAGVVVGASVFGLGRSRLASWLGLAVALAVAAAAFAGGIWAAGRPV